MHVDEVPTAATPTSGHRPTSLRLAWTIRRLAAAIVFGWVAIITLMNTVVPQLETVGAMHSVAMNANYAPSMIAMKRIGEAFGEGNSDSSVMIVLEGTRPLGDDARHFYTEMVQKLEADQAHVRHVQDFWGDPMTAPSAQSQDGLAAYVQVHTVGNQGEALANESVQAVQHIIDGLKPPTGVKVYVTGSAALAANQMQTGNSSLRVIEAVTFVVIITTLLLVYRSIVTLLIVLTLVVLELLAARGVVALLGFHNVFGLSTFATNFLVTLAIAASTDYAVFLIGRYQEARQRGQDTEAAYYTMFRGTAHVVLASGLTIAGAAFCLRLTKLPYFQTLGFPLAVGMVVVVLAALTLGSAIVVIASRFGLLEPRRKMRVHGWRKIGTTVVRWPGPILIATIALCLVGVLALPGYKTNYNDREYLPKNLPANAGFAAAERHFPAAAMNPEVLMIESDHDTRNSANFLVIEKIAKAIFNVTGIGRVQTITRPRGTPIEHTSIPYLIGAQGTAQQLSQKYMNDRMNDMAAMGDQMELMIHTMDQMIAIMDDLTATTGSLVENMRTMVDNVTRLRDGIADFDDFFRPIRNYFYWEPHCYNIPVCWSLRSVFDTLDGIDTMTDGIQSLMPAMEHLNAVMPEMQALFKPMIATMKSMRTMMLTMQATMKGIQDQQAATQGSSNAMGEAFDEAKNDDSFYLPPEVFDNHDFQRGMKMFISPNGHAVRYIISHEKDPLSPEGIAQIDAIKKAAAGAVKGTPLEGSTIYLAGTAATFKDIQQGSNYDLLIAGIASLSLIFIIMLLITRGLVAAVVIVGTVVLSLATSFGLSVVIWQHVVGIELHWMVLAMSAIILLAVGADYNLLLVSRLREEIHAGINTGIIRGMGGSGSVVSTAGAVFAFTMISMSVSGLVVIGQIGTTIGLGLLFDTFVIRAFMTPSIAALLARWFWWPQVVRSRPLTPPTTKTPAPASTVSGTVR